MNKKLVSIFVCVMFLVLGSMTVMANTDTTRSQDGLISTLRSSETEYEANEEIDLSLTVTSINPHKINQIYTKITLPNGIMLKSGSLIQDSFSLDTHESITNSVTVIKTDAVVSSKDESTSIPHTGNSFNLYFWLTCMIISGGMLILFATRSKKHSARGMLSLILCFALLGGFFSYSADAANMQKSFTVTSDIVVDGETFTIIAEIFYDYV